MEDLSLDDVIRRRGFNNKGNNRPQMRGGAVGGVRSRMGPALQTTLGGGGRGMPPLIHRGVGGFDARQKIGVSDARLRLGGGAAAAGGAGSLLPMKDARERLGQKDARFRIRGQIQDARQTINSRKQGGGASEHQGGGASKLLDARDRLSLKRSIPMSPPSTLGSAGSQATPPVKITKTIQQRPLVLNPASQPSGARFSLINRDTASSTSLFLGEDGSGSLGLSKQMKITTANNLALIRPGVSGPRFSLSKTAPLTKVVQNDSYTASPPAPSPPPPLPLPSPSSILRSNASLAGVSRTLVQQTGGAGAVQKAAVTRGQRPEAPQQSPPQLPVFSPLEGTKMTVNNLHPRVTEEDIVELFCVCGALKRAKLVRAGFGEVVFVKQEDAVSAYRKYNNRCLDGQPMKCNLHMQGGSIITSDQPILLRLSDTPGLPKKAPSTADLRQGVPRPPSRPQGEVDPETILRALFKSSGTSTASAQPTAFQIKI